MPTSDRSLRIETMILLPAGPRSEEHTSELQSQSHISYAVFCLKKKRLASDPGEDLVSTLVTLPEEDALTDFNVPATTEIYPCDYTLSLHDALPIYTEGLINLPLTVKEIQAVVFFKQSEGEEYR